MATSILVRVALPMALIASVVGCNKSRHTPTSTATLIGCVWDVGEDQPLEGVTVTVGGNSGTTLDDGCFNITRVRTGCHPLSVSKLGYELASSLPPTACVEPPTTVLDPIYMIESVFTPPGPPPPGP